MLVCHYYQRRQQETLKHNGIVLLFLIALCNCASMGTTTTVMAFGFSSPVIVSAWKKNQQQQHEQRTITKSSSIIHQNMVSSSTRTTSSSSLSSTTDSSINTAASNTTTTTAAGTTMMSSSSLSSFDPEIGDLIALEEDRQRMGLELIASENFCSSRVREVLGSCLTNKYSEGQVGKRYYGGNTYIDQIEALCQTRALELYGLDPQDWHVNVQPYSGSPANFAVYTALLQPHDRIMGLDLPAGGHLTHGFMAPKSGKRISASSIYFESMPYTVDVTTGTIDYDDMERRATMFRPKLLIAGGSAYPQEWDYARMRQIADDIGALFMVDMAHISGLVAAGFSKSPFDYADVVTSTTHKTLRGPRSGMIFSKKQTISPGIIDSAVFPALQGGPHNNNIGALAVALKEASTPEFTNYAAAVIENAKVLSEELMHTYNYTLITDGTVNHLMLWKVFSGSKVEKLFDKVGITTNKNSIVGDTSAFNPGGIRLGTPALTSRGFTAEDFQQVASYLHRGYQLALKLQQQLEGSESKKIVKVAEFVACLETNDNTIATELEQLRCEVETFSSTFYMPGYDDQKKQ